MDELDPINRTLVALVDNQVERTRQALAGLAAADFDALPGGDCNSIRSIGEHLLMLRGFQLKLLESPLADDVAKADETTTCEELVELLDQAADLVRQGIAAHDSADWFRQPEQPRRGPWPNDATIVRVMRPLNDYANHLGAIRTIRRIRGQPA